MASHPLYKGDAAFLGLISDPSPPSVTSTPVNSSNSANRHVDRPNRFTAVPPGKVDIDSSLLNVDSEIGSLPLLTNPHRDHGRGSCPPLYVVGMPEKLSLPRAKN